MIIMCTYLATCMHGIIVLQACGLYNDLQYKHFWSESVLYDAI